MAVRHVRCDCDVPDAIVLTLLTMAVTRGILMNTREDDSDENILQKVR